MNFPVRDNKVLLYCISLSQGVMVLWMYEVTWPNQLELTFSDREDASVPMREVTVSHKVVCSVVGVKNK